MITTVAVSIVVTGNSSTLMMMMMMMILLVVLLLPPWEIIITWCHHHDVECLMWTPSKGRIMIIIITTNRMRMIRLVATTVVQWSRRMMPWIVCGWQPCWWPQRLYKYYRYWLDNWVCGHSSLGWTRNPVVIVVSSRSNSTGTGTHRAWCVLTPSTEWWREWNRERRRRRSSGVSNDDQVVCRIRR